MAAVVIIVKLENVVIAAAVTDVALILSNVAQSKN